MLVTGVVLDLPIVQIRLLEGSVFTAVCLSTGGGEYPIMHLDKEVCIPACTWARVCTECVDRGVCKWEVYTDGWYGRAGVGGAW